MAPLVFSAILVLAAAAAPTAAPTPREPLHEIGHVKATTPFCQAFAEHFNGSARALLSNDEKVSFIGFTLGSVENHFKANGGELLLYDDRVNMMHYADGLFKAFPALQAQIDELRRSADLTKDPDQAKAARATAAQLQKSLDKQHQIALDTMGVVQALQALALGSQDFTVDTTPGGVHQGAPPPAGPSASTQVQGNSFGNSMAALQLPQVQRDLRNYIQFDKQVDRIAGAESDAVGTARAVSDKCEGDL